MSIFYITSKLKRKEPFSPMAEVFLDGISKHLKRISVPRSGDKIYKEECVFSFDTPVSTVKILFPNDYAPLIVLT